MTITTDPAFTCLNDPHSPRRVTPGYCNVSPGHTLPICVESP
jgi:hypothetical protein